jgi:GT2 family glycosyltransferase
MRISVIIPSYRRAAVLHDTVTCVLAQTLQPSEIILPVAALDHLDPRTLTLSRVRHVVTRAGSSHQRNAGIRAAARDAELVAFFDDDVELAPDYLARAADAFAAHATLCLVTGLVLEDGVRRGGVSRERARAIVAASRAPAPSAPLIEPVASAYGCNMVVRRDVLEQVGFDERLPLYGWLEDLDFSYWCAQRGMVARAPAARMVHMGVSTGRVSGRRYGFSQVVNPFYLNRKGSLPSMARLLGEFWIRPMAANVALSLLPAHRIDRRGRLIGNLIGIGQLLRGRVAPEHILRMR